MMTIPLQVSRLLDHGATVHANAMASTWTGASARQTSYRQVGADAARLAHALRELGVTGDERVATLMWNNAEHLIAYLAVPSMGAVLHPLNLRLYPDQLAYIANHAQDRVIIVDATLLGLLAGLAPQLTTVRHVIVVGEADLDGLSAPDGVQLHRWDELLAGRPEQFDWPDVDEDDAAALCYTSGTTGHPKGVAYSHRSIYLHSMQVCAAESFGLSAATKVLAVVPMFHAMAWGLPYACFLSGAEQLLPDRFLQAGPLAVMIAAERPTLAGAVPTIWTDLLAYLDANPTDISSLREAIVGGSACPPALMRAFADRHGVEIIHAWGMTETSPLGSVARPPAGVDQAQAWSYRYTQGRIPASVQARVVGPDAQVVTDSSVGELEVRGPWITGSYLGDEQSDPEKFRDGWLRTGDVGVLSTDGYLTLTDRAKDVIKSGGEWISSVELENALMAHPLVQEACVVAVPDERWGERPLATVVVREGGSVTAEELREFLAGSVPRWQLPERWAFVATVPRTSVGKFDKKLVRAQYADGSLAEGSLIVALAHG
jgi:acyl-CoA synthetase (AMP-forming)/AMP-acid ligase II